MERTRVPTVYVYVHVYVRMYIAMRRNLSSALECGRNHLVSAGPHACEDCGGDPRCRHRCRVGTSTVVYRDVFYADNAHYGHKIQYGNTGYAIAS
jgi:hypothetical protein